MKHLRLHILILATIFAASLPHQAQAQITYNPGTFPTNQLMDIALMYYGKDFHLDWTEADLEHYLIHTFQDGRNEWLFPCFLYLENEDNNKYQFGYDKKYTKLAAKQQWQWIINRMFEQDKAFDALDKAITKAKQKYGEPPFRHKVIMMIPFPAAEVNNWGTLNGRNLDFATPSNRIIALKWYIDTFLENFTRARYKNFDLEGFYWFQERETSKAPLEPEISNYIHQKGLRLYWIPYYNAPGHQRWKELGFDIAYMQTNYFLHPQLPETRLIDTFNKAKENEMAIELEIDERFFTQNETYKPRVVNILDYFEEYGIFDNCALSYYLGKYFLKVLDKRGSKSDKLLFDRLAQHIVDRNQNKKSAAPYNNDSNNNNNNTPVYQQQSRRRLHPDDWHF